MKQRLLIITWHELDRNNGGANGSKGFIHCFAQLFDDCSIIYRELEDATPYIPVKYKRYPCYDTRSRIRKGIDMYRGILCPLHSHVVEHLKHHHYDIIVIDHSISASSLIRTIQATCAKIITIHHNVERDYLNDNRTEYPIIYRYPYLYYAKKAERDCLLCSDLNLTVTERDATTFRKWYASRNLHIHNWGDFEYRPIKERTFCARERKQTFIITGSLNFVQSQQPIMDFLNCYWPLITNRYPGARLIIAGRNPSESLILKCAVLTNVEVVPDPEDMSVILRAADYYICPINVGSGLKLRIMDALKEGLPILCHEVSCSGYESIESCGYMFSYHDEDSFTRSLSRLVSSQIPPAAIYKAFKEAFSLETGIEKLRAILKQENISDL